MIFLWVLTWFSYWLFLKQQINSINIIGAVISAGLLVFSHFYPNQRVAFKGLRILKPALSQNGKKNHLKPETLDSKSKTQERMPAEPLNTLQSSSCDKIQEFPQQPPVIEIQKQKAEFEELAEEHETAQVDKSVQAPTKSKGCPKNLRYYTQKPRPKQTPEECFTCENLIACVCLTDN
jgi:hypothetical protein